MVPLSDLLIYASFGLVMALSLWTFGRHRGRAAVGMLIFLSCMSQLLLVQGLNLFTCLLIASGIGLRTAGWFESRLRRSRRLIPPGIVALLVIVIGLAGGSLSWERSARTRAERGRNAAASPVRNVLLIVLDTVRADHLGLYGYARPTTPNLSRLANEGVRFERARSTAPWTLPSHASLFTGAGRTSSASNRSAGSTRTFPTLAEYLGARGYSTAGFIANQFFCGHESGLSRGFATYRDYPVTPAEVLRSSTLGWFLTRTALRVRDELAWALGAGLRRGCFRRILAQGCGDGQSRVPRLAVRPGREALLRVLELFRCSRSVSAVPRDRHGLSRPLP